MIDFLIKNILVISCMTGIMGPANGQGTRLAAIEELVDAELLVDAEKLADAEALADAEMSANTKGEVSADVERRIWRS